MTIESIIVDESFRYIVMHHSCHVRSRHKNHRCVLMWARRPRFIYSSSEAECIPLLCKCGNVARQCIGLRSKKRRSYVSHMTAKLYSTAANQQPRIHRRQEPHHQSYQNPARYPRLSQLRCDGRNDLHRSKRSED